MKEDQYLSNWDHMKPLVLAKWDQLNAEDLNKIQPVQEELLALLETAYPSRTRESLLQEIRNLQHQVPNNPKA